VVAIDGRQRRHSPIIVIGFRLIFRIFSRFENPISKHSHTGETAARPLMPRSDMKDADDCCGTTVFGCFPGARRKNKSPKAKSPPPPPKPEQHLQGDSPGGSVQAFYRQNRGKSCRKIMRFNGYPNKVSQLFTAVCRMNYFLIIL